MSNIEELASTMSEIFINYKNWVTIFECDSCGLKWEESYVSQGHSNIVTLKKLKS